MDVLSRYQLWCRSVSDPDLKKELEAMADDPEAMNDAFYRDLEFGTAGLRGVLGAGSNRMNVYVVGRAAQGLANYLKSQEEAPSVSIAYDSRILSKEFAELSAEIMAGNGIHAHIYPQLMPTPTLSFAVRHLASSAGINVTASHNPSKYNGYKVYGPDGCQITELAAGRILSEMGKVDPFLDVKRMPLEEALKQGLVSYIGEDTVRAYLDAIDSQSVLPKDISRDLKIVYTPLNGAGISCVPRCLSEHGFTNITIPPEQERPDGRFPTCPYPNPEIKEALELALKKAEEIGAEFVLATDPDCDRVGTAVRKDGVTTLISGNQMGVLLIDFLCRVKKLPADPVAVKTVVTTKLAENVCRGYGVELRNVLTGFKYIGEVIHGLEEAGQEKRFLLGYEESYGYLTCPQIRDKDAVNASLLICEMFAWYKSRGKSVLDGLEEIQKRFGYYSDKILSFVFEGQAGFEKMQKIMDGQHADPYREIAGIPVQKKTDYKLDETGLPKSNVVQYELEGGTVVTVRPSGTEPKLKIYLSASGKSPAESDAMVSRLESFFRSRFF